MSTVLPEEDRQTAVEAASATSTTEALWALAWDGVQEALDIVMAWGAKQGDGGGWELDKCNTSASG